MKGYITSAVCRFAHVTQEIPCRGRRGTRRCQDTLFQARDLHRQEKIRKKKYFSEADDVRNCVTGIFKKKIMANFMQREREKKNYIWKKNNYR